MRNLGTTETLWTFTIVTTDANKQLSWLHDRMPLILSTPAQLSAWLDTSNQEWTPKLAKLVRPYSVPPSLGSVNKDKKGEVGLECYAVPKEVGKVGTESETFIEPVNRRKDGIEAMFSRQKQKDIETKSSPSTPEKAAQTQKNSNPPESRKRTRATVDEHQERHRSPSVELLGELPTKKRHSEVNKLRRFPGLHLVDIKY